MRRIALAGLIVLLSQLSSTAREIEFVDDYEPRRITYHTADRPPRCRREVVELPVGRPYLMWTWRGGYYTLDWYQDWERRSRVVCNQLR